MARQRVNVPAGTPEAVNYPEIKPFPKCACGPNAPYPEVLAKTGGRCPICLRGVHVGLPDLSPSDPSYAKIVALRSSPVIPANVTVQNSVAFVAPATTAPPPPMLAGVTIQPPEGLGPRMLEKGASPEMARAADAMILDAQKNLDAAVEAIDVKAHEGDEITIKLANERYGEKDSFSSYGVPEVHWTTRVRPGEHPIAARNRAVRMARMVQDEERAAAKQRYLAHLAGNPFKA